MTNFVLVHGSFHGPWCWDPLTPALTARGHQAVTPDLTAAERWVNSGYHPALPAYTAEVEAAIRPLKGKTILVGHSMGGIVASQVAETYGDAIAALVYVSGLLLRSGESLRDFIATHTDLGVDDLVLKNMSVSDDGAVATFPANRAAAVFYNACTEADAFWAIDRLRPQPTAIYASRLALTPERYGRVPRYYVATTRDRAVPPAYQQAMTRHTPCTQIFTLDADHSPFLSRTAALADLLLEVDRAS